MLGPVVNLYILPGLFRAKESAVLEEERALGSKFKDEKFEFEAPNRLLFSCDPALA
jgi:hypothetical protein